MKALLVTYLWVTGIGAVIVIVAPWLVMIGYMALILPGVLLSLLPSAFLYGVVFALVWFPLHGFIGDWPAAAVAAIVTAAGMYALPIPGNRVTEARYRAELAEDTLPAKPIELGGHIRIDRVSATDRQQVDDYLARRGRQLRDWEIEGLDKKCNDMCTALLFQDGVESVTVSETRSGEPQDPEPTAVTYALVDRSGQACATLWPLAQSSMFFYPESISTLRDYWKLRVMTDRCLIRVPTRRTNDWRIVASNLATPLPEKPLRSGKVPLGPRSVDVERLEIFDAAGHPLLRQTRARAVRLGQPLLYMPSGGMSDFRFRWLTSAFGPREENSFSAVPLLERHAGLDLSVDADAVVKGVREHLAAVVADPARTIEKPTADMVPSFFASMYKREVPTAELDLAIRLVNDRRFTNFDGLFRVIEAMGNDAARLRAPIVARLLAADPAVDSSLAKIGQALERLPLGTFATLTPDDAALLADPLRRTLATGLIKRQADRGAAAAPLLVAILGEQFRLQAVGRNDKIKHYEAIGAAIAGLTRIGPEASDQLAAVEALVTDGVVYEDRRDSGDWQLMLMRLGKPIEDIPEPRKPSSVSNGTFHGGLREDLKRYERDLEREAERRENQSKARR